MPFCTVSSEYIISERSLVRWQEQFGRKTKRSTYSRYSSCTPAPRCSDCFVVPFVDEIHEGITSNDRSAGRNAFESGARCTIQKRSRFLRGTTHRWRHISFLVRESFEERAVLGGYSRSRLGSRFSRLVVRPTRHARLACAIVTFFTDEFNRVRITSRNETSRSRSRSIVRKTFDFEFARLVFHSRCNLSRVIAARWLLFAPVTRYRALPLVFGSLPLRANRWFCRVTMRRRLLLVARVFSYIGEEVKGQWKRNSARETHSMVATVSIHGSAVSTWETRGCTEISTALAQRFFPHRFSLARAKSRWTKVQRNALRSPRRTIVAIERNESGFTFAASFVVSTAIDRFAASSANIAPGWRHLVTDTVVSDETSLSTPISRDFLLGVRGDTSRPTRLESRDRFFVVRWQRNEPLQRGSIREAS